MLLSLGGALAPILGVLLPEASVPGSAAGKEAKEGAVGGVGGLAGGTEIPVSLVEGDAAECRNCAWLTGENWCGCRYIGALRMWHNLHANSVAQPAKVKA